MESSNLANKFKFHLMTPWFHAQIYWFKFTKLLVLIQLWYVNRYIPVGIAIGFYLHEILAGIFQHGLSVCEALSLIIGFRYLRAINKRTVFC